VERFQVIAYGEEHAQKKWLLPFDQVDFDPNVRLKKLLVQLGRSIQGTGDVDQLGKLELEVLSELVHLDSDFVKLLYTVLSKVVH